MWPACSDEGAIAVSLHLQPRLYRTAPLDPRFLFDQLLYSGCLSRLPPSRGRWEWPRPANYRHAVNKTLTRTRPAASPALPVSWLVVRVTPWRLPLSPRFVAVLHNPQHVGHHPVELEILRGIDGRDPGSLERSGIVGRNDAADDDRHVIKAGVA